MIYLNNAATTYPKPPQVCHALKASLEQLPEESGRSNCQGEGSLDRCRSKMARLLGAKDAQEIFFTSGATESANLLLLGLSLENAHVIATTTEHNALLRPLLRHPHHPQVTFVHCNQNGFVDPEDIIRAIRPNTQLLIVNHCSNVTGCFQPLEQIGEITRERNILLLADLSQSLGCLPVNVAGCQIDMAIFTGHKNLFGPPGTGGFFLRKEVPVRVVKVGGTGVDSHLLELPESYRCFETGTLNFCGVAALEKGMDFLLEQGMDRVSIALSRTREKLFRRLKNLPGLHLYGPSQGTPSGVVSFTVDGFSVADLSYMFRQCYDICLRSGLHCCPLIHEDLGTAPQGTMRMSFSFLTPWEDLEVFVQALEEICLEGKESNPWKL